MDFIAGSQCYVCKSLQSYGTSSISKLTDKSKSNDNSSKKNNKNKTGRIQSILVFLL